MRCRRTELCMSNNAAERELRLAPQALSHDSSPFQTLRRPDGGEIIEFRHGLGARRERHPGLFRRREYVDVWGASIGIIERANPHEADSGSGLRVIAPDCNLAGGAARDLLASSAGRWHIDDLRLARGVHDSIRLVEGVERVRCTGLALAPATVAGVDDERRAGQSIRIWRQVHPPSMEALRPMVAFTTPPLPFGAPPPAVRTTGRGICAPDDLSANVVPPR